MTLESAAAFTPADAEQLPRLGVFRDSHPDVTIGHGTGYWQSWWREAGKRVVVTKYTLGELLDALDAEFTPDEPG